MRIDCTDLDGHFRKNAQHCNQYVYYLKIKYTLNLFSTKTQRTQKCALKMVWFTGYFNARPVGGKTWGYPE
jgi:hypothetical protein